MPKTKTWKNWSEVEVASEEKTSMKTSIYGDTCTLFIKKSYNNGKKDKIKIKRLFQLKV